MPPEDQLAAAALHFLQRVNLQGAEVDTYLTVRAWLQMKVTPPKEERPDVSLAT